LGSAIEDLLLHGKSSPLLRGKSIQPGTDVYIYAGWEHASRAGAFSTAGYGSPTLTVTGCNVEGAAATTCQAETRDIRQITGGFWHDLYKGSFGRLAAGA
jgi:hypothetical protein